MVDGIAQRPSGGNGNGKRERKDLQTKKRTLRKACYYFLFRIVVVLGRLSGRVELIHLVFVVGQVQRGRRRRKMKGFGNVVDVGKPAVVTGRKAWRDLGRDRRW